MELVKLIIVSHKRADKVKSAKCFANAAICVEESQADEYRKHNPDNEIIVHPDSVVGLSAKYRWIHERYPNVAMIGDDIDYLRRNYLEDNTNKKSVVSPEDAYEIIQATAFTAKEMGAKIFAFSKESNPLTYPGHWPFRIKGIASGGVIGLFEGFQLKITDRMVSGLDYFLSGLNAYHNRYLFVDERYFTYCQEGTFVSQGGMADFRTIDTEKNDYLYLKELFGSAISVKKNVKMRNIKHEYERTFKVPF